MSCAAPSRHALTRPRRRRARAYRYTPTLHLHPPIHLSAPLAAHALEHQMRARESPGAGAGPAVRPVACCLLSFALCSLCPSTPYMCTAVPAPARACLPATFQRYAVTLLTQNRKLNA
ncbi:hypothetical protein C8J57DRAFT_1519979 [Mycena rebaudengoi]|nr:hypothetical protein C8J57DRAFT_1519979 [Mycena rebaudengoi]